MRFLGFEIRRVSAGKQEAAHATVHSRPATVNPFSTYINSYEPLKVDPNTYRALMEGIPCLQTAVSKLVQLQGVPVFSGTSRLEHELEDWMWNVRVGALQRGFLSFWRNHARQKLVYGRAATEIGEIPSPL